MLGQAGYTHCVRKVGPGFVQLSLRQAHRGDDIHHRTGELDLVTIIAEGAVQRFHVTKYCLLTKIPEQTRLMTSQRSSAE
jgi:hypothetical protein